MKLCSEMSDDELFDAIREQVNLSRNYGNHNRKRTREISDEMIKRGWKRGLSHGNDSSNENIKR